jgi:hypothetical protein
MAAAYRLPTCAKTTHHFNIGYAHSLSIKPIKVRSAEENRIFKSGDRKRELAAWKFIKWFTDTAQTAKWSAKTCYMPVRKSAMQSPELLTFLQEFPSFKVFMISLKMQCMSLKSLPGSKPVLS